MKQIWRTLYRRATRAERCEAAEARVARLEARLRDLCDSIDDLALAPGNTLEQTNRQARAALANQPESVRVEHHRTTDEQLRSLGPPSPGVEVNPPADQPKSACSCRREPGTNPDCALHGFTPGQPADQPESAGCPTCGSDDWANAYPCPDAYHSVPPSEEKA